jgi:hypothetical protein
LEEKLKIVAAAADAREIEANDIPSSSVQLLHHPAKLWVQQKRRLPEIWWQEEREEREGVVGSAAVEGGGELRGVVVRPSLTITYYTHIIPIWRLIHGIMTV